MNIFGRIPLLAELGLVVLLAWMVSGLLLPGGDKIQPTGLLQNAVVSSAALPDLSDLLAVPLFGKATPKARVVSKPVVQKAAPVVVSRLNIKLLGTVVAGENSAAIVSIAAHGEQSVVFIGDDIQPGVKLIEVETEAIVVERANMLERISLEQGVKLSSAPMDANTLATGSIPQRAVAAVMPTDMKLASVGGEAGAMSGAIQRQVDRGDLRRQLSDFPALMSQARVVPHFVNGKSDGFVISDIVTGSLYQQVGLRNGDVIRKVNGKQVSSAQQAMTMYKALESATSIDLELMRAGQVQQVHYDIR